MNRFCISLRACIVAGLASFSLMATSVSAEMLPAAQTAAALPSIRYVATTGDDSSNFLDNSCLNKFQPCRTIAHTVDQAVNFDTVSIADGLYIEAILVSKSLHFIGTVGRPVLEAPADSRVFTLAGNVSHSPAITIENFLLRDGAPNGGGGCISAESTVESLTLTDVKINSCVAQGDGGGLNFLGNALTLDNVDFFDNTASGSGGALFTGDFVESTTINDSTFYQNVAGIVGGAIAIRNGVFSLSDSDIALNSAAGSHAGGIDLALFVTDATIERTQIDLNTALISGGGLRSAARSLVITDSSIEDNQVLGDNLDRANGGGIALTFTGKSSILNSVIQRNSTPEYGGGVEVSSDAHLTLIDSTISANEAERGGGIRNRGTMTMTSSTISFNQAGQHGGGLSVLSGSNSIISSTISFNRAPSGGGISSSGTPDGPAIVMLEASTLNGHRQRELNSDLAASFGGGINNGLHSDLTLRDSTLSGNNAELDGGNLYNHGSTTLLFSTVTLGSAEFGGNLFNSAIGTLRYSASIIANAIDGGDCDNQGTLAQAFALASLIGDASCPSAYVGNPRLLSLANNGGQTLTHALDAGSPALDRILPFSCAAHDQRGVLRPIDGDGNGDARCDVGAYEYDGEPAPISSVRYVATDGSNNGNACLLAASPCLTIAHAIAAAQSGDEIRIDIGIYKESLAVDKTLAFVGSAVVRPIIEAPEQSQLFTLDQADGVGGSIDVTFKNLVLRDGESAGDGGCIETTIRVSLLKLTNVHVFSCEASGSGGGIYFRGRTLDVIDSEISENVAAGFGGGIYISREQAYLTISNTVAHNNAANAAGGAVSAYVTGLTVISSQIVDNSSRSHGGGIDATVGRALIDESTFSDNSAYRNGGGLYIANSIAPVVIRSSDFERNHARLVRDDLGNGGGIYASNLQTILLDDVSLHQNEALLSGGGLYIEGETAMTITASRITENKAERGAGFFNTGTTDIDQTFIGRNLYTIQGGGIYNGGTLTLTQTTSEYNLVQTEGDNPPPVFTQGGGIYNSGTATVHDSRINNNQAQFGAGFFNSNADIVIERTKIFDNRGDFGVGIFSSGTEEAPASILLNTSALYDHHEGYADRFTPPIQGGGIVNGTESELYTFNTTLSGNEASSFGGNLYSVSNSILEWTTVALGSSASGGNIYNAPSGSLRYSASIIADAAAGGDCVNAGSLVLLNTLGSLVENEADCPGAVDGDPRLLPLADNGGPTWTHALAVNSDARDRIVPFSCADTDQRGYLRLVDESNPDAEQCDIGAFESDASPTAVGLRQVSVSAENASRSLSILLLLLMTTAVISFHRKPLSQCASL